MSKPITPNQCKEAQKTIVPDWVIAAFNELIIQKWDGKQSKITVHDLSNYFAARNVNFNECENRGMLKIIPIYSELGWEVVKDCDTDINEWFWIFTVKNS